MSIYEFRFCLRTKKMRGVLLRVDKETDKMLYGKECHPDNCSYTYGSFALRKDDIGKAFVNSYRIIVARVYSVYYDEAKIKAKRLIGDLLNEYLEFTFGGNDE